MEVKLKFLMVKPVLHKAYTLLESLLIILFISIFWLYNRSNEYIKVLHIKSLLEKIQIESFVDEKEIQIEIKNDYLYANDKPYKLNTSCTKKTFHFNEQGNISQALTLQCGSYSIVMQLGSGSIEIR